MTFQPYPTRSGFIFLGIALIAGSGTIFLLWLVPQQPDWAGSFWLFIGFLVALAGTGLAFYWAMAALKLHYQLTRNGVAIQWGLAQQRIPFNSIQAIIAGRDIPGLTKFRGLKLAGLQVGRAELAEYGSIKIRATAALDQSLLVIASDQSYLISPRQPEAFLQAWQLRQPLGPTQNWSADVVRSWPLNEPVLTDSLTWGLLGVGAVVYLALIVYLSLIYTELPAVLPIHFDALGQADRIAEKSDLLTLPAASGIVLGLNALLGGLIYRWDKVAAYLLWGSATVMQLFLWIALLTITT
jgi:hypothetical protein